MRNRPLAVVIAALTALTLAACDGGGGDGGGEETSSAAPSEGLTSEDSPLNQMFAEFEAFSDLASEDSQRYYDDLNRKIEEAVATCMSEQGFDYTPSGVDASEVLALGADLSEQEYAAQYGYGIVAQVELVGVGTDADPNAEAVAAMSEAEQAAWNEALYGDLFSATTTEELATMSPEDMGCYGSAQNEVIEQTPELGFITVMQNPEYAALITQIAALSGEATAEPAVQEAAAQWSECMAEAGHPDLAEPADAQAEISAQANELWGAATGAAEGPDESEVDELQQREIEMATADLACQDEVGYQDTLLTAQFALEEEFITENQTQLDAMVEAMQQAQAQDS